MKKTLFYYSRLALLCVPAVVLTAQTDHTNAFTGTWKLDVAKSQFSPGPPPQSVTVTVAPDGAFAVEGIDAQGKPIKFSHAWSGGKEVPVSGAGIDNETVITKVHGRTWNDDQDQWKDRRNGSQRALPRRQNRNGNLQWNRSAGPPGT